MSALDKRGVVFNIQHYSLHDGPGIRTVVFLKGCPLRCAWCSNPESQHPYPELYFDKDKCIYDRGCGFCEKLCSQGAIMNGCVDFTKCTNCLSCAGVCPSRALSVYGRKMSISEIIEEAEREQVFYRHGGGGITLSGGEPLMQAEFAIELLKAAKERHIHTAIETCGYADTAVLLEAARYLDFILYDVKILDERKHERATGVSNRLILKNLEALFSAFPKTPKLIRTPVIPGVNDTEEEIRAITDFLKPFDNYCYELLPYHRFGEKKYKMLGRAVPMIENRLDEKKFQQLRRLVEQ